MRRSRGIPRASVALAAVGCVVAGVSVAGAAELRADQLVKATSANTWDKTALAIETGDTVTWDFAGGAGVSHNVQKDPAEPATADPDWETFTTDYASSGRAPFTFNKPGTYKFVCGAHSATMFGTVVVTGDPVEPTATATATPSQTADADDHAATDGRRPRRCRPRVPARPITTPAPIGAALLDTTAADAHEGLS